MNRFFLAAGDWVHGLSSAKPMNQPSILSGLPRRSFSEGWSILSNSNDTIESNSLNMKLIKSSLPINTDPATSFSALVYSCPTSD
jgi:hypothetical protein